MARTVAKWLRVYIDGLNMSGFTRNSGPLGVTYAMAEDKVVGNALIGYLKNQATISMGPLSVAFDTTVDVGPHENFKDEDGAMRTVLAAIGMGAEPVAGDTVFAGQFEQGSYYVNPSEENQVVYADMAMAASQLAVAAPYYEIPWGVLLHPLGEETTVNAAIGIDNIFTGGATAFGGFLAYQLLSSDGTVELIVEDAAVNTDPSFATLVSSGEIDASAAPKSGVVALARDADVRRYLRWQLAFGTATEAEFVVAFIRDFS